MAFDDTAAASQAAAAVEAEAGAGAVAVLHGMLATLAEVLGELDQRLVSIEAAVHDRSQASDAGAAGAVTAVVDGVHHRLDRLAAAVDGLGHAFQQAGEGGDDDAAFHAIDAVAARLEARLDGLEASVRQVATHQARLVEDVQRLVTDRERAGDTAAVDKEALREEFERLELALRGQAAEITGQARSVAEVLGVLDGRLRDIAEGVRSVSQHAGTLAALPKRLEAIRDDLGGLTRGPGGGMANSA